MSDTTHDPTHPALAASQAARASAENSADALRNSELRYRRLFETARDGILILDSELGRVTDANPFMTELLGYPRDELVGKELWEIGLLKDKDASQESFRRLKQDGYIRYEDLPLETSNGDRREVELVGNLYRENGHTVIQCYIRDISDRKRVAKLLADAASRNERIADSLQRSMLQAKPSGKFTGIAVETLYKPALTEAEVGGDFFDAFVLDDVKVAFVVGDVSGKGLVAAERTAEVKYALRAMLHEHQIAHVALSRLNQFICKTHLHGKNEGETFIVIALAVVDTNTGEAEFSAAGAEAPLILRMNDEAEQVQLNGTPLGIRHDSTYSSASAVLRKGDTIIMATDGITEARRGDEFLGIQGMATLVEKAGACVSLDDLALAIYDGALEFAERKRRDDVCLLLARFE